MGDTYLTGGELTALTMVYWTVDPLQFCQPKCLLMAIDGLRTKEMIRPKSGPAAEQWWELTPKGKCLMDAINSLQEPINVWVIP